MATLQSGSQGTDVKVLQQDLQLLGYTITVDGDYGNGTQTVVEQFQKDNSLIVDGIDGPETQAALNNLVAGIVQGIDISHLNGPVNYNTLSSDGISYVFCKASQGTGFTDPQFQTNYKALTDLDIMMAPYHFFEFENAPAQAQADNFFKCNVDFTKQGILPPVVDIEWQSSDALNQYIIDNQVACVRLISDWLTIVATQTGKTPIIYTNANFWHDYLGNPSGFGQYPLWIAAYQKNPPPIPPGWADYTFWQFSGSGGISSVSGQVDRDRFNGSLDDLKKLAGVGV
jgi:lysozyme